MCIQKCVQYVLVIMCILLQIQSFRLPISTSILQNQRARKLQCLASELLSTITYIIDDNNFESCPYIPYVLQ